MKKLILFIGAFSILGCSHIRIVAYDKQANTVSVQGGKFASMIEYRKAAEKYCGGPVSEMSMSERTVGSMTSANAQAYGNSAYGTATTVPIRRYVHTYKCD